MRKHRTVSASKPQTIRLEADAFRIVKMYTDTCGWSASRVVNKMVLVAWTSMRGHPNQAKLFQEQVDAAVRLFAAKKLHAAQEAELRKVERTAAAKLRPPTLTELTPAAARS